MNINHNINKCYIKSPQEIQNLNFINFKKLIKNVFLNTLFRRIMRIFWNKGNFVLQYVSECVYATLKVNDIIWHAPDYYYNYSIVQLQILQYIPKEGVLF